VSTGGATAIRTRWAAAVRVGPAVGLAAQAALLGLLSATVGLGLPGWAAGLTCAVACAVLLDRGLAHHGRRELGPADRITLARESLVVGVAALAADAVAVEPAPTARVVLVVLAALALALDGVDGWVARRTGTQTALGARYDGEVDALLMLVLSVAVAASIGAWVLVIGGARYAFWAAGRVLPWLRRDLPPRYWRKVVTAYSGIVLVVAAAGVAPPGATAVSVAVALMLVLESFGRDVVWLWRHRAESIGEPAVARVGAARPGPRTRRARAAAGWLALAVGVPLTWFALVAPDDLRGVSPVALLRIPLEGLLILAALVVLPPVGRRLVGLVAGGALAALFVVRFLDTGFLVALDRPFNPAIDWRYLDSALGLLVDSIGRPRAVTVALLLVAAVVGVLALLPWVTVRLGHLAARHRRGSLGAAAGLAAVWVACAGLGASVTGVPVASIDAGELAYTRVSLGWTGLREQAAFDAALAADAYRDVPGAALLRGLRGKDVVVVFVESYGRVALEDGAIGPGVNAVLARGDRRLADAGFGARSAFLTSPTFGGISWLAHATLGSGVWTDTEDRYDSVLASDRLTLSAAFHRAGWRTVGVVPANEWPWPEGEAFYRYDHLYDRTNVGYAGPMFGYAPMPDQYVLAAFRRLELEPHRDAPVMAEVDLVSSHTPWAPLPRMVDWRDVGDGSVFGPMAEEGPRAEEVWRDDADVRAAYGRSVEYSLSALISFVQTYGDDDLVLVVLGDHQPATVVAGADAGHDVPVSIVAADPAVLAAVDGWGWHDGLRPRPDAPVWPMDAFRDRFLAAFSTT
jgi:phosphatidylglycerophosphate synthase